MKKFTVAVMLGGLLAALSHHPVPGLAQDFAGMRGTVVDETGAVVIGVDVTAKEENSGLSYATVTNEVGEYELRGLTPGTYTLMAQLAGFKKYENTGVIVYAYQVRRVDIPLEVGQVEQTVTVVEVGSIVSTDDPAITYRQSSKEVYAINQQANLIYHLGNNPGAEARSQVHGNHANQTLTDTDGITTDAYQAFRAPQETMQEAHMIALNAPAEHRTATHIMGIGRSGANDFHSELYLEFRHDRLNALPVGAKVRPKPQTPTTTWSWEASGPIRIPGVYDGRDKSFFHWLWRPSSGSGNFALTGWAAPTPKERLPSPDLSQFANVAGIQIMNPFTGQPFPNNIIPESMVSPVARNALDRIVPEPNFGAPGDLTNNTLFFNRNTSNSDWYHLRLDHALTDDNQLNFNWFRYDRDSSRIMRSIPIDGGSGNISRTRAFSFQDSHTFSATVINEASFGYNNQGGRHPNFNGNRSGRKILMDELGISDLGGRTVPDTIGQPHFLMTTKGPIGAAVLSDRAPVDLLGNEQAGEIFFETRVAQFRDNISIQHGKHLFKTGFEIRKQFPIQFVAGGPGGDNWGAFAFNGQFTGYDYADFLLGLPSKTSLSSTRPQIRAHGWEVGWFIQDDWKVLPNLTINAGVRLQHYGVPVENNDLVYNFDIETRRVVVPNDTSLSNVQPTYPIPVVTAREAGYPDNLINFKSILVDPRLGLAWRPTAKTVLRAAYGIYHVPYVMPMTYAESFRGRVTERSGLIAGRAAGPFVTSESFDVNTIVNGVPSFTLERPFPTGAGSTPLQTVYAFPPDLRKDAWSYDQQWNITLENELGSGWASRLSYVGSKGTHWPYVRNLQTPPPSTTPFDPSRRPFGAPFQDVYLLDIGGNGSYHGFEAELTRQFSSGVYFRGWYTWRKSLSDVIGGLFGSSIGDEIENPFDRKSEKGSLFNTPSHQGRLVAVVPVPYGRGQRYGSGSSAFMNQLLGNWTLTPFVTFFGHSRFTPVFGGRDPSNTNNFGGRADQVPGCGFYTGNDPGESLPMWNRSCFEKPSVNAGRFGNVSNGMLHGPWGNNINFNAFKRWYLGLGEGGPYFQADIYVTNLFNHAGATGVRSTNIESSGFGVFRRSGNRRIFFRFRIGF